MPKTLRVTFSGICTRAPGYPRDGEHEPQNVYVLMPAARSGRPTRDGSGRVSRHHAFIYAPAAHLEQHPEPAFSVDDEKLGLCHVYLVDQARITFNPAPMKSIEHYVTKKPLGERPGSRDIAPEQDVRWLVDMRDIVPTPNAVLNEKSDPRRFDVQDHVAMIVELNGGVIKANFPCKTVQPQTFDPPPSVPMDPRVIASEFIVEMEYADSTSTVSLDVTAMASREVRGFDAPRLVINWGPRQAIDLRIGNDTRSEIVALQNIARCNARPEPMLRDNDFDLHYQLLAIADDEKVDRPLPTNSSHQTQHNGCAGAGASLNSGGTS